MHLTAISRVGATHWFLPAFTLALGLALGGAQWIGDDAQTALTSMVFFLAIAAVFFWGGRSETIRMIAGTAATSAGPASTSRPRRSPAR